MPRLVVNQSIAAGATVDLFANSQYRYLPWHARVRIMLWSTATGVNLNVMSGSENIQPDGVLDNGAAAGNIPTVFDVDPLDFVAPAGDLLQVNARNTTGGALVVTGLIDVNPG